MENFNGFPSYNSNPFPDLQNASGFVRIQRQDYQTPYPYKQYASPLLQPHHSSSYLGETSGMINFEPTLCLNSFPFVAPSRRPILETAHSIQSLHIPESGENKKLQAKVARANRKKAREMSANRRISTSISSSLSGPPTSSRSAMTKSTKPSSRSNRISGQDHYILYTPYNVREAEENLPALESKEGIQIEMKEVYSNREWKMQYRFWANHKGKMYLLDHCDDFVKKNMLEAGDQLKLYQDELGNLYFTIKKKEKQQENVGNNYMSETTEEEDSSLRTLLEALKHNDDTEANSLNNLYTSASSSVQGNYYS
ncbi:hypothetical protein L6452_35693 [Arctium lappa]|uniref:Uncharacterized protein n=1 Tax=Arctium lappa TaxID=4217 RepID=A0ACB8Y790_ARCLA|nr:hypothetical protein L6452_35693 [Arctium lappa]